MWAVKLYRIGSLFHFVIVLVLCFKLHVELMLDASLVAVLGWEFIELDSGDCDAKNISIFSNKYILLGWVFSHQHPVYFFLLIWSFRFPHSELL